MSAGGDCLRRLAQRRTLEAAAELLGCAPRQVPDHPAVRYLSYRLDSLIAERALDACEHLSVRHESAVWPPDASRLLCVACLNTHMASWAAETVSCVICGGRDGLENVLVDHRETLVQAWLDVGCRLQSVGGPVA